jgi:hypothetical protein
LKTLSLVCLLLACSLKPAVASAADKDPRRFTFQGQAGLQLGYTPGYGVLAGLFFGGGPRYKYFEASLDATLALGPASGYGFSVLALAMISIGARRPNPEGTFVPYVDGHLGGGFFTNKGNGQTDAGPLWGGATAGFRAYGVEAPGGMVALTGFVPLQKPERQTNGSGPIVPLLLRGGITLPR